MTQTQRTLTLAGNRARGKKKRNGGNDDSQTDGDIPHRPQHQRRNDQKRSGADLDAQHFDGQQTERQYHSHEQDRIADHVHDGVDRIAMRIRVIRKLALEIVSHAEFTRREPLP